MNKKPTLHGIFIGIDTYGANVSNLSGCKNDIKEYKKLLTDCYNDDLEIEFEENVIELFDDNATYNNVTQAFDVSNFQNIKREDIFLFIYSGHGARERQAKEFNLLYPEGYSETLVLHDSRAKDGKDLADKETAILLNRIGEKCDNIIVIFDCCHAGSGTRNINDIVYGSERQVSEDKSNSLMRSAYTSNGLRKYDSYLNGYYANNFHDKPIIPDTKHILLAACDEREKARELSYPNKIGAFTKHFTETVRQNPTESYLSLFNITRLKMRQSGILQNPRINNYSYFNAYGSFLLNESSSSKSLDLLNEDDKWIINIGAIQGVPTDKDVFFNIYFENQVISKGKVDEVFPNYSTLKLTDDVDTKKENLKASLISPLSQPILVENVSNPIGKQRLSDALEKRVSKPINFEIVGGIKDTQYSVLITNDRASIIDNDKQLEIIAYVGDDEDEIFENLINDLESISIWEHKLGISNKKLRFDANEVEFIFTNKNTGESYSNQELIEIELAKNEYDEFELEYELSIVNKTQVPIKCTLLYFSPGFGIDDWSNNTLVPNSTEENHKIFELKDGYDVLQVPKEKNETCDIFKLFISTEEYIEAIALTQEELPFIGEFRKNGVVVCDKQNKRGGSKEVSQSRKYRKQWFTKEIRVKTIKKKLSFGNDEIRISDKIKIIAPKELKGDILTRVIPTNSKSLDSHQIVNQFFNGSDMKILSFESERSLSGVPNCIEIKNVQNEAILNDSPIIIEIDDEGEGVIVPMSYDGEHFIPLDYGWSENGKFNITIGQLPKDDSSKSIIQSCRLFFVKVDTGKVDEDTHMLKWIDTKSRHELDTLVEIKKEIDTSQEVLLLIHGILGNTVEMIDLAETLVDEDRFDAILTFNYENLNTPIETTAGELLDYLKLIGIDKHKQVTILAHSMGGLVSRSMIEQMNGNEIVKKLVLAGTPNKGSKVAQIGGAVVQWMPILFFAFNLFRDLSNVKKLLALAKGKFKMDKTLNQMTWEDPDRWLKNLGNANDPKIPYYLIHGNLDGYLTSNSVRQRLLNKAYKFGGKRLYPSPQKSDLVVSEQSMRGVPENRNPKPISIEVPSIHMTYFSDEESIRVIKKVL